MVWMCARLGNTSRVTARPDPWRGNRLLSGRSWVRVPQGFNPDGTVELGARMKLYNWKIDNLTGWEIV